MFCVECGSEPDELYEGLCAECFKEKSLTVEIEERIDIEICPVCGSIRKKNNWIERPDREAIMLKKIDEYISVAYEVEKYSFSVDFHETDTYNIIADITVDLISRGIATQKNIVSNIIFKKTQCSICSKIHGDYYEAILQVRPTEKELTEEQKLLVINKIKKRIEVKKDEKRNVFLTAQEEKHGGMDFYLSDTGVTKNLAHEISRAVGGKVKSSAKLAGREDGQNIYRMTYSVRIPAYDRNDFVELDDKIYRVKKFKGSGDKVVLNEIKSGRRVLVDDKQMENAEVIGGNELIQRSVIVSKSKNEMKVLDPENYETVTLLKPEGFETDEDEVPIIKVKGHLYIIEEET